MVDSWLQQKLRRQVLTLFHVVWYHVPILMGGVILADSDKINCVG